MKAKAPRTVTIAHTLGPREAFCYGVDSNNIFAVTSATPGNYAITHLPTGYRLVSVPTRKAGLEVLARLEKSPGVVKYFSKLKDPEKASYKNTSKVLGENFFSWLSKISYLRRGQPVPELVTK